MSDNRFRVETIHQVTSSVPMEEIDINESPSVTPTTAGPTFEMAMKTEKRRPSVVIAPGSEKPSPSSRRMNRKRSSFQFTSQRSLRHYLTREVLPHMDHYRDRMSFAKGKPDSSRPTLDELLNESSPPYDGNADDEDTGTDSNPSGKVIKFGWIDGVYMRCLLNIWGVMLFLRLTWVIGQAGLLEGLAIITLSNIVTVITTISMSAVSTNGQIKAGGIYYMISRSLGPEFGGAIGLMFTLANSIAVAMYVIGFSESLLDMLKQYVTGYGGIVGDLDSNLNDVRLIGSISLVLLLGLAIVGMEWVTRVQKGLLVLLVFSQIDFIVGSFLPPGSERYAKGFVGYNASVLESNIYSDYTPNDDGKENNFFTVFAVFFPAVTGIVAGANLSGDLKDPGIAIPKGTLSAIVTTYITYIVYGIMVAACSLRQASGDVLELPYPYVNETAREFYNITQSFDNCTDRMCDYGTLMSQQMMEVISVWGPLIYAGCFAATLSSAIASLVGAPRVFQAVAKDKLFPGIHSFSEGWGANNDPVRGYILVFVISLVCILIGDLNIVSSLLSNFFVAAYALINFSVFHASITKSPGWRPGFTYYNKWVSLFGTVLCISVMFLMDLVTALVTFIVVFFLYMYVLIRKPEVNWGSSTQAQSFMAALYSIQTLVNVEDHVKNYRPKLIVLSGDPRDRPTLVDFANLITKRVSLLGCASVVSEDTDSRRMQSLKQSGEKWLSDNHIKAFYSITRSNRFSEGARSAMELVGLGKLSPNMMLMGFKEQWWSHPEESKEYFRTLQTAIDLHLAVGVLRINGGLDVSRIIGATDRISEGSVDNKMYCESNTSVDSGLDLTSNNKTIHDPSTKEDSKKKGLEKFIRRKNRMRPIVTPLTDKEGKPIDEEIIERMSRFRDKKMKKGCIDVYWLYDDGGLTLLLPHILHSRSKYLKCQLRIFFLSNKNSELDSQTRNMAALLAKFRIDFQDVIMLTDATKRPTKETRDEFQEMITANSYNKKVSTSSQESTTQSETSTSLVPETELIAHNEKTNFHLRIAEIVRANSSQADLVVMTLPLPKKDMVHHSLYMAWLDFTTRNMPPFLLVRGNQTSVLTFYS